MVPRNAWGTQRRLSGSFGGDSRPSDLADRGPQFARCHKYTKPWQLLWPGAHIWSANPLVRTYFLAP